MTRSNFVPSAHISRIRKYLVLAAASVVGIFFVGAALIALSGLHDDIGHADLALVLGSKVEAGGEPSARLRARLDKTVEMYRAGWFPEVIASGGVGREGYDEATVMKDYLVSHGLPAERVIVDNRGATTLASAWNTARILREKKLTSVMVISQYFHIPRAKLALGRVGVATIYGAHANFFEMRDIYSSLREFPGCMSYFFRRLD